MKEERCLAVQHRAILYAHGRDEQTYLDTGGTCACAKATRAPIDLLLGHVMCAWSCSRSQAAEEDAAVRKRPDNVNKLSVERPDADAAETT